VLTTALFPHPSKRRRKGAPGSSRGSVRRGRRGELKKKRQRWLGGEEGVRESENLSTLKLSGWGGDLYNTHTTTEIDMTKKRK